jgi:hypothetical protein
MLKGFSNKATENRTHQDDREYRLERLATEEECQGRQEYSGKIEHGWLPWIPSETYPQSPEMGLSTLYSHRTQVDLGLLYTTRMNCTRMLGLANRPETCKMLISQGFRHDLYKN